VTRSGAWQRLPEEARKLFGVELGSEHLSRLGTFLDLVETWSARMNLVGKTSRDDLVERHLLDSFAPAVFVGDAKVGVDFGSGAGFPAVPLAVVRPDVAFHLVESRRKRSSFLRQVSRSLRLANATVTEARGEDWEPPAEMDFAIGRAIAAPTLNLLAARVLSKHGRLIVMRKQGAREPLEGFREIGVERYRLPGGEHHEVAAYQRST